LANRAADRAVLLSHTERPEDGGPPLLDASYEASTADSLNADETGSLELCDVVTRAGGGDVNLFGEPADGQWAGAENKERQQARPIGERGARCDDARGVHDRSISIEPSSQWSATFSRRNFQRLGWDPRHFGARPIADRVVVRGEDPCRRAARPLPPLEDARKG